MPLRPPYQFALNAGVTIFSSALLFLFGLSAALLGIISVSGKNPLVPDMTTFSIYVLIGIGIGAVMLFNAVRNLYRLVPKPKDLKDIPPLDKKQFTEFCDEIKTSSIGSHMMNHVLECEDCKIKSMELNKQVLKHVEDSQKLI
jgi:hypothetical protein